jgi:dipeptidyl-peptidase-4
VTEIVDVDEAGGRVAFVANRGDPTAYQLFTVPLEGGAEPTQISTARGCHDVVASPDHRHYVDVHSSLDRPRRAELLDASGAPLALVAAGDLGPAPDLDDTTVRIFTVPGPDGIGYQAELFQPARLEPGRRYPVILAVYGGPAAQDVMDQWYPREAPLWRAVARRGVLVFSMDGRGTSGRGHDWERPIYRRLTEVELEDQLRGVEYLRSLPYVDGDRIGVFGWSYGGTMTLAALLRHPGTFRVGVAVAPVTDWRFYDTIYTERYMTRPQDNPDGYQRTALWPLAGQLQDPLLLVHGLSDDNVHFRNSERMIQALVEEGRRLDVMVYPGQSHGIAAPPSRRHVFATIVSYLLEHLLGP